MNRGRGKLKVQWIEEKSARQQSFRRRRATLMEKAEELSTLCEVPVVVFVHRPDEAGPTVWPEQPAAADIFQRYVNLPDSAKETHKLDNQSFMNQRTEKLEKKIHDQERATRDLETIRILNQVRVGRRTNLDDLSPGLAATTMPALELLRKIVGDRVSYLMSSAGQKEAAALMAPQEPPMVPPLAVAPMAASAPLLLPPLPYSVAPTVVVGAPQEPPMAPVVAGALLVPPPQSALVVAPQGPPMVAPLGGVAPMEVDAPLLLPPAVDPQAASSAGAAAVNAPPVEDLLGEPRGGSFLLEMVDAILDDGSGRRVQATAEDVDRVLKEHGLDHLKPM